MTKLDLILALIPKSAKPAVEMLLNTVPALRCAVEEHKPYEMDGARVGAKVREGVTLYFCVRCRQPYWE